MLQYSLRAGGSDERWLFLATPFNTEPQRALPDDQQTAIGVSVRSRSESITAPSSRECRCSRSCSSLLADDGVVLPAVFARAPRVGIVLLSGGIEAGVLALSDTHGQSRAVGQDLAVKRTVASKRAESRAGRSNRCSSAQNVAFTDAIGVRPQTRSFAFADQSASDRRAVEICRLGSVHDRRRLVYPCAGSPRQRNWAPKRLVHRKLAMSNLRPGVLYSPRGSENRAGNAFPWRHGLAFPKDRRDCAFFRSRCCAVARLSEAL